MKLSSSEQWRHLPPTRLLSFIGLELIFATLAALGAKTRTFSSYLIVPLIGLPILSVGQSFFALSAFDGALIVLNAITALFALMTVNDRRSMSTRHVIIDNSTQTEELLL